MAFPAKARQSAKWEDAMRLIEPQVTASGIHDWHFERDFPLDLRNLRLHAPSNIALRRHDYYEVLFLEEGEAVYRVEDRAVKMRTGDLFVMGSAQYHGIQKYLSPSLRVRVLYFLPHLIWREDVAGESAEYLLPFEIQGREFPHVIAAATGLPKEVRELMRAIQMELAIGTARARLCAKTYLKMILVLLIKHYASFGATREAVAQKERNLSRLRPLFDYLDAHHGEPISVEDAAGVLHMSKPHFMRFFRGTTGQPFISHLNRFRVAKAQHLMATTEETIAEISQEVGFCDQSYFGLIFRRLVGMTPREYRARSGRAS
ncbi:MAG: AraC family transcriptional regulator [Bryobacteraceae bacterium]|nr:AraC family transcriptional regulator [Bryobacteraceae bacterium]